MPTFRLSRDCQRGQSATPILVFLGIVVLSVVFFVALTLPRQLERRRGAEERSRAKALMAEAAARDRSEAARGAVDEGFVKTDVAEIPDVPAAAPAQGGPADGDARRLASPRQFMHLLVSRLEVGDVAGAEALLGSESLAGEKGEFFRMVFGAAGLRPRNSAPIHEIGDVAEYYRWGVRLEAGDREQDGIRAGDAELAVEATPDEELTKAQDSAELEVDVGRDPQRGWRAVAVHFPESLRLEVASRLGASSVPPSVAVAAEERQDPLKIAGHFLSSVLKQDYSVARSVTDTDQVTREKVAGLCILFEEGAYAILDERPLSATAAGADAAWVIVKVKSARDGKESDFGLELRRLDSGAWQVAGVNFSKMLAGYAASAGATEGVPYTPIVKNPGGGESLVVYFDFNDAALVPRAQRQLEIVANLLRDDPRRKLRLSGHADAIGSDAYNRQLSAARALAVRDALATLGVSGQQIVTEGLGTLRPLDANTKPDGSDNPEGRSRNRRTEIYLDF
ncbi:MAG: OmpA family protein [Verrucomicrobiales bacterium]